MLLLGTNYSAIIRPLQWLVVALIFLFFLRVVRAVFVEVRPAGPTRAQRRAQRKAEEVEQRPARDTRSRRQLRLEVIEPREQEGSIYDLDGEITVGRSNGCGIPTTYDSYSSTLHARLYQSGGQIWVEDLGSTNGTYVNSERISQPSRLAKGDLLQIGATVFEVRLVTVLRSGVATDIGRARESNEDRAAAGDQLFAVADGMGGARGGEVAARMAIETLQSAYDRNPTIAGLREAFVAANTAIWEQSLRTDEFHGMGTTLTAAGLTVGPDGRDLMCLANVGDSRAYLMSSGQVRQITADHSLAEERVRHGEMTEAEAEVHPHRHILTRALGVGAEVAVDLWELHVKTGDRLLLCSDGLTNEVSIEQLGQVLTSVKDPRKAARALVDRANAHGGSDNVTVVVVDVLVGEDGPPVPSSVSRVSISEAGTESSPEAAAPGSAVMVEAPAPVTQAVPAQPSNGVTGEMFVASASPVGVQTLPPRQYREEVQELAPPPRERRGERRRRLGIPRRITVRVILFFLLLLAVPAGGIAVVRWYSMDNWYVALDHGHLAVYQGRQGGFLGFKPKLLDLTGVTTTEVLPFRLPALKHTVNEPSLQAGERYIANLHKEFVAQQNQTPLDQES